MFVVSVRVPFYVMGELVYVNRSVLSPSPLTKGTRVDILESGKVYGSTVGAWKAEVIESNPTKRIADSFAWEIV